MPVPLPVNEDTAHDLVGAPLADGPDDPFSEPVVICLRGHRADEINPPAGTLETFHLGEGRIASEDWVDQFTFLEVLVVVPAQSAVGPTEEEANRSAEDCAQDSGAADIPTRPGEELREDR
jgi:hypothetical protein